MTIEDGDVIRSIVGFDMYMLVLESRASEDPICARVLILDCYQTIVWTPGEVGLIARSALCNGNFENFPKRPLSTP